MFFYLSKIVWAIIQPTVFLAFVLMTGVVLLAFGKRRMGLIAVGFGTACYCAIILLSAGQFLIAPLESRYPANPQLPEKVDGILVLSGPLDRRMTNARQQLSIRDGAERYLEFAKLLRQYKDAKAVISGGNPSLNSELEGQAIFAKQILERIGIEESRVIFEINSRNTDENIRFSYNLLKPSSGSRWVIITSAYHMPRVQAVLKKLKWNAIPYPVDFRSEGQNGRRLFTMDSGESFAAIDLATKEYIGILSYYLTGKSAALWP